jgi:hypothetical protein
LLSQTKTSHPDWILDNLNAMPGLPIRSRAAVQTRLSFLRNGAADPWTEEQVNTLLALRSQGVEWIEIKAAINALPGRFVRTRRTLQEKYESVRRGARQKDSAGATNVAQRTDAGPGADAGSVTDVSSLTLPPAPKEPEAFLERNAVKVSYEDARRWARLNGLCGKYSGLNLVHVNAARASAGMPKFVIAGAL